MVGYVVYLAVQQQTAELAHQALPGARVYPMTEAERQSTRGELARIQVSRALRQIADRVEPRSVSGPPAVAGGH